MRKQILTTPPPDRSTAGSEKDVAALATVLVSSEHPDHPIDHAFDQRRGRGGSRWLAGQPGEQVVILAFDAPQEIRRLTVEIEEPDAARTQELQVAVSEDAGRTYRELVRQEYTFSPPDTTFEREQWTLGVTGVTHLRLAIKPDKGSRPARATLTSLVLE